MTLPRPVVVLIVEDEVLLRLQAAVMLEDEGFDVVEAADADEAIQILQARTDIRIVFTDIHMPGSMDGLKLAAFVRDRWPPIELIVTSAHHRLKDDELPERGVFFPKPYDPTEIIAAVHRLAA